MHHRRNKSCMAAGSVVFQNWMLKTWREMHLLVFVWWFVRCFVRWFVRWSTRSVTQLFGWLQSSWFHHPNVRAAWITAEIKLWCILFSRFANCADAVIWEKWCHPFTSKKLMPRFRESRLESSHISGSASSVLQCSEFPRRTSPPWLNQFLLATELRFTSLCV